MIAKAEAEPGANASHKSVKPFSEYKNGYNN